MIDDFKPRLALIGTIMEPELWRTSHGVCVSPSADALSSELRAYVMRLWIPGNEGQTPKTILWFLADIKAH